MTILVIDIGSSSVRALLYDESLQMIDGANVTRSYQFQTDMEGKAVVSAEVIRALLETCLDDILAHPRATKIQAVGMASFVGNILGLDAQQRAITPVFTYADTRSHESAEFLRDRLGEDVDKYHQATGCRLHTAYLPAQLHWFKQKDPDLFDQVQYWASLSGYLYRQWFGWNTPMSYSVAAWTGLLHTEKLNWHEGYLAQFGLEQVIPKLPALADYDHAQQGLRPDYAKRWQALRNVPFFLALGDGAVANVGSGAVDSQHIALTMGTTSAIRVVKDIEVIPAGLWRYLICEGMPLVGGALSEGGNVFQWGQEELGLYNLDIEDELAKRIFDAHGLTVLPLMAGERSPGWHTDASGTIHGIRRNTSRMDILQASMEAVAIRLSLIANMLKEDDAQIMVGGGALHASETWSRMVASALNSPIYRLNESEITGRGVAIMVMHALNGTAYNAFPPTIRDVIKPTADNVLRFQAAKERQIDLYERLYG